MSLQGNWVDLVILLVLAYFIYEAIRVGLWIILADFLSFLLSLLIALRGYHIAATFFRSHFAFSHSISNALGFLFTAIIAEAILGILFARAIRKIPKKYWNTKWTNFLAVVPAIGEGIILISFVLTLILGFPIKPVIKQAVADSRIGSILIAQTSGIERGLGEIFGGVVEDSLTYFTVKPESHESVPLNIESNELSVDEAAEGEMFKLVNQERVDQGLPQLIWDPEIVPVSRAHATDMWKRKYFGHVSPDGEDVGDRLDKHNVNYMIAGENLALAPTTPTAHTGLMNSNGHRANILHPDFRKIGIGVIDNGYYGKMYVQVFTD